MPTRPTSTPVQFGSPSSRFQFATTQRTSKLTPKSVKHFKTVTIDGRPLTIKSIPTDVNCLQPVHTWNKLDCKNLDSETKQLFVKSATGYVLTKSNKLTVFSMQDTDDDKLKQLNSLQTQLKLLRAHMQNYDILDVFTIVVPTNVLKSSLLTDYYFDLLRDYAKLDDNIVANSCAWYNMWVQEEYVQENMAHIYTLLQNNTTELLWNKCLEEYEEYAPSQQGGPLMFFLIIRCIQSNSETAIEHLKKQIKNLKLRDLPGENVDTAVSLIKTTYQALENASTLDHSYIPEDSLKPSSRSFKRQVSVGSMTPSTAKKPKSATRPISLVDVLNGLLSTRFSTWQPIPITRCKPRTPGTSRPKVRNAPTSDQVKVDPVEDPPSASSCSAGTVEKKVTTCVIVKSRRMKPTLRRTSRNSRLSSASTTARRARVVVNLATSPSGKPETTANRTF
jgi:hypothetical protein